MDAQFQSLPPLKRFRLIQKQHHEQEDNKENNVAVSLQLPAKKRRESREPLVSSCFTHCLPAKKRVWAFQPDSDLVSGKPLWPLDLNVEYAPSDEKVKSNKERGENPFAIDAYPFVETQHSENNDKEIEIPILSEIAELTNPEEKMDVEEGIKEEEVEEEDDGILCAVCESTDGDPSDPIVFCDGCDLMVHTTCYGYPLTNSIPEGDWFCAQCLASQSHKPSKPLSCCLCPIKNGAMKPTNNGAWAHIVCALFVPEVFFEDPDGREGIDCSKVPKRRWNEKCYVCKRGKGCVIECSEPKCPLAFHVTCGLKVDLYIEYQEGKKNKETIVAGFCKSHTELWKKQQETGKFKIVAR